MEYKIVELRIAPISETAQDILCAMLGDIGFDSFEPTDTGLRAYIPQSSYSEPSVRQVIADFLLPDHTITYTVSDLEQRDWNQEWEQNSFDPILERQFGIRLSPRGAFGSGSHPTTYQLVSYLSRHDFAHQYVLDMGCGTGVLGICMAQHGAAHVLAIDIDPLSVQNTQDNFHLNSLTCFDCICGDATSIIGQFNTIVANIHRNIIICDLPTYAAHLLPDGTLILSGFFLSDIPAVVDAAHAQQLTLTEQLSQDDWAVLVFQKNR